MFGKKQTVADQLVELLVQAGVQRIYGIVGDSLNPFSDAIRRSGGSPKGGIDWVHVHNEESAAFAASAARRSPPARSRSAPEAAGRATPT